MTDASLTEEEMQQAMNEAEALTHLTLPASVKSSDVDHTSPLMQCLVILIGLHGKTVSARHLMAGLPAGREGVDTSLCIRAARTAGMRAKLAAKPTLGSISPLTLPCILLLKDARCCVLVAIKGDEAEVIFPETGSQATVVPAVALAEEYSGYTFFASPEAKLDKRASDIRLLKSKRWFWDTLLYFLPIYRHVLVGSVMVNLLSMAGPLFFMNVYDRVVPNSAIETLWVLAVGIGLAYLCDFGLRNLRSYFVDVAGRNADVVLASRLMQHLMAVRLDNKPDSTGSLANNLREFESLREFFGSTTLLALLDMPFLLLFLGITGYLGGEMVIVPFLAVPLVIGFGLLVQYPFQRVAEAGYKEGMQKNALLVEIINGLETVKTSMGEGRLQHAWEKVVGMSARSNARAKGLSNLSMTVSMLVAQLVSVIIIVWGVYKIADGTLTMGGLIACNMLASRAMAPLSQIAAMLARLQQSRMALKSLDTMMSLATERPAEASYVDFGHLEHSFSMEGVSFMYPRAQRLALDDVTLRIAPGERVALIGRMGSGKSTLGRLLLGLYQPRDGAVKFGGVDIRQMDIADLRGRVGYLSQDNYLFYGTLTDNIALGVPGCDSRMVMRAAELAGVTEFACNHPAGFGMQVGERGMALSGGQRQAVALARALLHDPDVLILDEPSSNMDNGSELGFKTRLKTVLPGKTLLLITHRMSMIDLVDRIIVLDAGRVVADGPREAVLQALRSESLRGSAQPRTTGTVRDRATA